MDDETILLLVAGAAAVLIFYKPLKAVGEVAGDVVQAGTGVLKIPTAAYQSDSLWNPFYFVKHGLYGLKTIGGFFETGKWTYYDDETKGWLTL